MTITGVVMRARSPLYGRFVSSSSLGYSYIKKRCSISKNGCLSFMSS